MPLPLSCRESARVLAGLSLTLLVATGCGQASGDTASDRPASSSTSGSSTASESSPSDSDSSSPAGGPCSYPTDGQSPAKPVEVPPSEPAREGDVPVTIRTSVGVLRAELDAGAAPCTVNSFVSLAEQGYFDGTSCHRLTTSGIFVLQCGDPSGSGMGGPGYSFDDELAGTEEYRAGTLAMANAGPDTNGSQFFVVYQDSSAALPPAYTVFGRLDRASVRTVTKVAERGTDTGQPDGRPRTPVELTGVHVG